MLIDRVAAMAAIETKANTDRLVSLADVRDALNSLEGIDPDTLRPRWVSVEERLPPELPKDDGAWSKEVKPSEIVLVKRKDLKDLQTAWYSYEYKCWTNAEETHSFSGVTHWQPLPELPKEGKNE